jgi:hypothetical protein
MSGDRSSPRLVRFWWVLAAMVGASAGAAAVVGWGFITTLWAIVGVGLPLAAMVGYLEWSDRSRARPGWTSTAHRQLSAAPRGHSYKAPMRRRGQLHAITRRKSVEPPSSSGS